MAQLRAPMSARQMEQSITMYMQVLIALALLCIQCPIIVNKWTQVSVLNIATPVSNAMWLPNNNILMEIALHRTIQCQLFWRIASTLTPAAYRINPSVNMEYYRISIILELAVKAMPFKVHRIHRAIVSMETRLSVYAAIRNTMAPTHPPLQLCHLNLWIL